MTLTHGKGAYEKSNFFDELNLDSNKKREENVTNKISQATGRTSFEELQSVHLDSETFGSVADQYRFASHFRRIGPHYNRDMQHMNNQHEKDGHFRYFNKPYYNNRFREQHQPFHDTWGRRRDQNRYYTTNTTSRGSASQRQSSWQPRQKIKKKNDEETLIAT